MLGFLSLPKRTSKPRSVGITHVLDKGMGLHEMTDVLATASDFIDIVKLGWGTGYVTQNVLDKIRAYHEAGIPVCFGGTLLEVAIIQNRFEQFRDMALSVGITHVEISTGVINMSPREKGKYIAQLAKDFVVLSEVGSKDAEHIIPPYKWVEFIESDLQAGAWKVICEARESGTVGLYFGTGEVRSGLIEEIVAKIDPSAVVFEAPLKAQQAWLIKKFGGEVNLGNISSHEIIGLETLRLGLRADSMAQFHDVDVWNQRKESEQELRVVPKRQFAG
jgi:phosphosulfolactate synthase